ncbi:UDP-N-acetylenolpyruvoylglucosamine reductase [Synergistales bacterium]|nr:UDP-N-acetylenolpyruvoylglucosamine reductase [Synergistales bacterium]
MPPMQKIAPENIEKLIRRGVPLRELTTFGVGGPAAILSPSGEEELKEAAKWLQSEGTGCYVIGGGSNILAADEDIELPVILMTSITEVSASIKGREVLITCGAGVNLGKITAMSAREGWSGIEFAAGIPGTVGGAIAGNAGTTGGDMSSVVKSVSAIMPGGAAVDIDESELEWGYRQCGLRDIGHVFIASAVLRLHVSDAETVARGIEKAVQGRKSQPAGARTAGCVFKNPKGGSAGRLLDMAGCKGLSEGEAIVSDRHANFIENLGDATAADIMRLAEICRRRVDDMFGVFLEFEIKSIGFSPSER